MAENETAGLLRAGIQAARMGNRAEALRLLKQVLEHDDANELAWLWMASVVETPSERRTCLETVLELNPGNQRARQELERLLGHVLDAPPTAEASPPELAPMPEPPSVESAPANLRRVRRRIRPAYWVIGALLLILIGVGVFLIVSAPSSAPAKLSTGTATLSFSAFRQTEDAKATPTARTRGTIIVITVNPLFQPPTWTPQPTFTPPPTLIPTATPVPLTGLTVLFAGEGRGRQNIGLYLIGADGKDEKLLLSSDARAFNAAWSPDGKQIAFITDVDGKEQLAVMAADGTSMKPLTSFTNSKHVRSPAWSPDGKQIAFSSDERGNDDLYSIDIGGADGSNLKPLTDTKTDDREPSWSPDGKQIAYAADATGRGYFQIYLLDVASGKSSPLTESQNSSYSPSWSPDGKRIAFVSTRDQHANIYSMNPDGSDEQLLTYDDNNAENRDPSWSPDSRWIVFSSNRADGVYNVYVMLPDGSRAMPITHQKDVSVGPRFRPGS